MESYLLVLASLILLIPIILYLPLGMTSKGKMIIIFGAIIVASIGIYGNINFPLWQTAGMLLLILIVMTFFMGEKFEGLIFDQEGNDLTAYHSNEPEVEVEEKADLIHMIANQNLAKHGRGNPEARQEQKNAEDSDEVIKNEAHLENIVMDPTENLMMDLKIEQPTETDIQTDLPIINWDEDIELLQDEPPLVAENEIDGMDNDNVVHETIHSGQSEPIYREEKEITIPNKEEPFGSLTKDEVDFLLNRDELIASDDLSVHFMEDIEILLEDEDDDLKVAADLMVEEPEVDPIVHVYEEDLPQIIDGVEEDNPNPTDEKAILEHSDELVLLKAVEQEEELVVNVDEIKIAESVDTAEMPLSKEEEEEPLFDNHKANLEDELTDNKGLEMDLLNLGVEPVHLEEQEELEETQSTAEQTALQGQLFDTFFSQMKLAKMTCSEDEYESLLKGYLTDELPDQTYYQFSALLLDYYIAQKKWIELENNLFKLKTRFEQYPILAEQLDYLYQTYCE